MLRSREDAVNPNSLFFDWRRFPQFTRRALRTSLDQGSENHPDFSSECKAFSNYFSRSFSSGGEGT